MAQTYKGISECVLDDAETLNAAKLRARKFAEQDAREKSAAYIKNFTKDKNFTLSDDEIFTITDSVLKFTDVQFGKAIIRANVTAQFDDKNILDWLNEYSREKTALVAENEELKRKIAELEQKLSGTKTPAQKDIPYAEKKFNEASAYFLKNDYRLAIQLYSEAIKFNPNYALAYFNRGRCYQELREDKKAEADFVKSREIWRNN